MPRERRSKYANDAVDNAQLASSLAQNAQLYNVKKYGAKGDGTTVDTIAIQSAINAANVAGGGTIFFPDGTYLTDTLTLYSNITIKGNSKGNTIIRLVDVPTGALFSCVGTSGAFKRNIHFENLTLKHFKDYVISGVIVGTLIHGDYTAYCSVRNCIFTDFANCGIYLLHIEETIKSWIISDNIFYNSAVAPFTSRGIFCHQACEYALISNNLMYKLHFGIRLEDAANISIINNGIETCAYGIYATRVSSDHNFGKFIISSNKINHNTSAGIRGTFLQANQDRGWVITDNQLLLNYPDGINLQGAYSCVISNNRFQQQAGQHGITLSDNGVGDKGNYNLVSNNVITIGDILDSTTGGNNVVTNNIVSIP
jgi:hypothetical protein